MKQTKKCRKSAYKKDSNNSKLYSDKKIVHEDINAINSDADLDFLKIQYQILSDRRINHNSMLWETPSMLFVAQTLLWSISLGKDINVIIRCAVSVVSVLIGLASFKNFERHRLMEIADAEQLYSIELWLQKLELFPMLIIHHKLNMRTRFDDKTTLPWQEFIDTNSKPLLSKKPSYNMWKMMFSVVLGCSVLIGLYNLLFALKKLFGIDLFPQLL